MACAARAIWKRSYRRDIREIQARYGRDLRGEGHLEEELLLREAAELHR